MLKITRKRRLYNIENLENSSFLKIIHAGTNRYSAVLKIAASSRGFEGSWDVRNGGRCGMQRVVTATMEGRKGGRER